MPTPPGPNVVLVVPDQHRGTATGAAGNPDVRTPNVDRLAAEGTRFRRAFANVPVCTPSRACLLTGQYPQTNDTVANDLALPAATRTLGEAFAEAGYRTGYVGKWHLDGVPRDRPTPPERRHGFDFWAAFNCSHRYFDAPYYRDGDLRRHEWGPAGETDLAVEFVDRAADADEPFFLVVSYGPPHAPYGEVPERYRTYDPDALTPRANAEPVPGEEHDPRGLLADYYAQVTAVDDQFGRLLDALDDRGLADETVVAYTSDHGDMLCSHGRQKKEQPETESIRVPLVVRYPGEVPAGAEREELASLVDVAPTLCSLAGVDLRGEGTDGTDLAPALRGESFDGPDSVFLSVLVSADQAEAQGVPEWRGVRTQRYTYARLADGTGWVLYDDEDGPWQLRNRVLDARDVRERLDGLLDEWLDDLDDPFLDGPDQLAHHGRLEEWHERERTLPFRDAPDGDGES